MYGDTFVVYLNNELCGQLDRSVVVVDVAVRWSAAVAMAVAAGTVCLLLYVSFNHDDERFSNVS